MMEDAGLVVSVSQSATHSFSKQRLPEIMIVAGLGVEGDAHAGAKVKHRYLVKKNPDAPNLAQVHLLQFELFAELEALGLAIEPGDMGENVTTSGLDLLRLPLGTRLHLGETAVVELTGLRTPCVLMDRFQSGLKNACIVRDDEGRVIRRAGVMALARMGGVVHPEDKIVTELPSGSWTPLRPV